MTFATEWSAIIPDVKRRELDKLEVLGHLGLYPVEVDMLLSHQSLDGLERIHGQAQMECWQRVSLTRSWRAAVAIPNSLPRPLMGTLQLTLFSPALGGPRASCHCLDVQSVYFPLLASTDACRRWSGFSVECPPSSPKKNEIKQRVRRPIGNKKIQAPKKKN